MVFCAKPQNTLFETRVCQVGRHDAMVRTGKAQPASRDQLYLVPTTVAALLGPDLEVSRQQRLRGARDSVHAHSDLGRDGIADLGDRSANRERARAVRGGQPGDSVLRGPAVLVDPREFESM